MRRGGVRTARLRDGRLVAGARARTRAAAGAAVRPQLPARLAVAAAIVVAAALSAPASAGAATSSAARSASAWSDLASPSAAKRPTTAAAARPAVNPRRFRALALDRDALAGALAGASSTAKPATIALPAPDGRFRRFAVVPTSVMEPALAAAHPDIATYRGTGIDDRGATVHLDLTPLGFHASVRGPGVSWYVEPYYRGEQSVYASYRRIDVTDDPHGGLRDRALTAPFSGPAPLGFDAAATGPVVRLRTYRLALVSDPAYAAFFGAANVTAAKVVLINRVNQLYEDDLAVHLTLVAGNDRLNFNTSAQMTGANGPCGSAPCYTPEQVAFCDVPTLDQTRTVIGQLIGASNYDIGHLGMGVNGGGVAYLGVVGDDYKGGGCTGLPFPTGDFFAIDYVAHEIGHQFSGNHTFDGCGGGSDETGVEPGSGSSIMAYAGICGTDDLQAHSDPYFSQRTIDEITDYVGFAPYAIDETQTVSLRAFAGTDSFRLTYNGVQSPVIRRGTNYTMAGIAAALRAIPAIGAAAIITVAQWDGMPGAQPDDRGFAVTFGGSRGGADIAPLTLTSPVGVTGFVGETARGGPIRNGGTVTTTTNHAPVVNAPAAFAIPTRTPFSLTGAATDADGDTLTYLWEQNDGGTGSELVSNVKRNGPLFRIFGTAADVSFEDALLIPAPGENTVGTDPTRVFPDLAQIAAGNTNAATGACPTAPEEPPVPQPIVDCFSEFLPTSVYANALHFRLTVRDHDAVAGGVAHDDTTLTLARTAGPFRVTSQASPASANAGGPLTVTWAVARTNLAPVSTASVRISLSTDGGRTFPRVLLASTPNDGSQAVTLPAVGTAHARIKVEAVGNAFFDMSHADLTIVPAATYLQTVLGDGPAGFWRLGEPSGTTLLDSSGHGAGGVYQGGVTLGRPGALAGDANTAARFDGVDDAGNVADKPVLDVGASFSAEAWIKRSSVANAHGLMVKGSGGLQFVVMNAGSGNQVWLRKANVNTIARSTAGVPADGRYHHVVATMNGAGTARIYIDGLEGTVQVGPTTVVADTASPLLLGGSASTPADFDELALYDRALTADEVAEHHAAGRGAP